MPPRFLQRMQRQSDVLRDVFGDPQHDPPPYPFSSSRPGSVASSTQYRQSHDLSAYHNRFSQDSTNHHQSQNSPTTSLHYRQGSHDSSSSIYHFPPPPGYTQVTSPTIRQSFGISALPKGSMILVTGANSFQGAHVVDQLLSHGFRVHGTVRDGEKAVSTAKFFGDRHGLGRYTTAVIPDMAAPCAFELAVRACSGVVHVASVTDSSLPDPNQVITPSIAGAINVLEAASKEVGVRRVVYCSCVEAAVSGRGMGGVVGGDSWNMLDFEEAWAPGTGEGRKRAVRASAKMQSEQAVWRWYWARRPNFVLNTLLPASLSGAPLIAGQLRCPSLDTMMSPIDPDPALGRNAPSCGHFVNASDSATLFLAALILPDVKNERIFAVGGQWNRSSLARLLESTHPEKNNRYQSGEGGISRSEEDERMDLTVFTCAERGRELLRRMGREGWVGFGESVKGMYESLL